MKTVVHFKSGPYLPITETWLYSQIISHHSYRPVVYALETINFDLFPTDNIRRLKTAGACRLLRSLSFYVSFLSSLLMDKPDLIHAHFGPSGYGSVKLKRLLNIPLITSFYGYDLGKLTQILPQWKKNYATLFRHGDLFLVEGAHMKNALMELGCPGEKILIHHLGVNLDTIKYATRSIGDDGYLKILIAGSFREKKGFAYAVDACGILKSKHPHLRLQMTIIGDSSGDSEGELQKSMILNAIAKHGLTGSVRMLGFQPHQVFIDEMYKHHIFLSPSVHAQDGDTEGGVPVAIIEASASGMPVLSTTHCDIPEAILNEISGYLVPERDVGAIVERLESLSEDHGLRQSMGLKGREYIEQNYDIKKQAKKLEEIYDSLLRQ